MQISKELTVLNEAGFHVRVATLVCKTATKYSSKVILSKKGCDADCKSCLDLLSIMTAKGESLTLRVDGDDAEQAAAEIETLFKRKFYEDEFEGREAEFNAAT